MCIRMLPQNASFLLQQIHVILQSLECKCRFFPILETGPVREQELQTSAWYEIRKRVPPRFPTALELSLDFPQPQHRLHMAPWALFLHPFSNDQNVDGCSCATIIWLGSWRRSEDVRCLKGQGGKVIWDWGGACKVVRKHCSPQLLRYWVIMPCTA